MMRKIGAACALLAALSMAALAQTPPATTNYPGSKPVRLIVPFPPGGGTDILSRLLAQKLSEKNQWTVIIDNRPGAGGTIGISEAVRAQPTGYDIVMGQKDNLVLGYYLYSGLPWNPEKDLTPVAHVAYAPLLIATAADGRFKTLDDVIAAAKAAPGQITYGTPGLGTGLHINGVMFEKAAGIALNHVPYKGSSPALLDTVSGHVDLLMSTVPSAMAQIKAGKLRPLAVTSAQRSSSLPDVPTVAELGLQNFDNSTWFGLFGPKHLPESIALELNTQVNQLLADPSIQQAILAQGAEPKAMSMTDFDVFFRKDFKDAKATVEALGAKIQ
ncbi:tripartite tricarboxylate transporter substrate binding protein [Lampropedia aestuarii]|uniref:Tripartite tricarboxylate transporter substrate binding protein n=1 Tax=Lampropedia aestuarii TaxID=2562762 RepID=A0A4S5BE13_9BURK|nr:tripartite tricarboxylate transporter substrate binding protein [Lampropedia aestuarii]THJ30467.1 tripartite tricarboxylate transporter substrate binding protein [Lampropedia aestuarii]